MRVIAIVNKKGGAGKTSAAVPLAYAAATEGRVAVIDLDPTPSASQWISAASLISTRLGIYTIRPDDLDQALGEIRAAGVDWVIIDTPPGEKELGTQIQAMVEADLVLIPLHSGSGDVAQVVDTFRAMRAPMKIKPDLKHLVVLNHTRTGVSHVDRITRESLEELGANVAKAHVPFLDQYRMAKGAVPTGDHYPQVFEEIKAVLA